MAAPAGKIHSRRLNKWLRTVRLFSLNLDNHVNMFKRRLEGGEQGSIGAKVRLRRRGFSLEQQSSRSFLPVVFMEHCSQFIEVRSASRYHHLALVEMNVLLGAEVARDGDAVEIAQRLDDGRILNWPHVEQQHQGCQ